MITYKNINNYTNEEIIAINEMADIHEETYRMTEVERMRTRNIEYLAEQERMNEYKLNLLNIYGIDTSVEEDLPF